jgi:hypothetical protein
VPPRNRIRPSPSAALNANMRGKSRSAVTTTRPSRRANARRSLSGARWSPRCCACTPSCPRASSTDSRLAETGMSRSAFKRQIRPPVHRPGTPRTA